MTRSRVLVSLRIQAEPERVFDVFTGDIGQWWKPNGLFRFTERNDCKLSFEPDPPERLVEIGPDGERFVIGRILSWDPPEQLAFEWRQSSFDADQRTEVAVRFEPVESGTRVTVEHFGWDSVPQAHAARHGFPLEATQMRQAEWWQVLLRSLRDAVQ